MNRLQLASVSALAITLSACGGGSGGGVASAPPPPVISLVSSTVISTEPLAPNPGTTSGNHSAIAVKQGNPAPLADGAVSLAVDTAAKTYTLTVRTGEFEDQPTTFGTGDLGTRTTIRDTWSNGTQTTRTNTKNIGYFEGDRTLSNGNRLMTRMHIYTAGVDNPAVSADYNGDSYVSLGRWYLEEKQPGTAGAADTSVDASSGFFAIGDRTPAGAIPITGTAQYRLTSDTGNVFNCADYGCYGLSLEGSALSVDFVARTIAAEVPGYESSGGHYTPTTGGSYDYTLAISSLSGSSPIDDAGGFAIDLAGSGNTKFFPLSGAAALPDITVALGGFINGAFFGPNAEALGGVYSTESMDFLGFKYSSDGAFIARKQ